MTASKRQPPDMAQATFVPLSRSQEAFIAFLKEKPESTIAEIMAQFGYKSRNAVYWHINRLEQLGALKRPELKRKGWTIKK